MQRFPHPFSGNRIWDVGQARIKQWEFGNVVIYNDAGSTHGNGMAITEMDAMLLKGVPPQSCIFIDITRSRDAIHEKLRRGHANVYSRLKHFLQQQNLSSRIMEPLINPIFQYA